MRPSNRMVGKVVQVVAGESSKYVYGNKAGQVGIVTRGRKGLSLVSSNHHFDLSPLDNVMVVEAPAPDMAAFWRGTTTGYTGADPEVLVVADGVVLPAWEFLPGKQRLSPPQTFWDGFQAEFTILPAFCHDAVVSEIRDGLHSVYVAAKNKVGSARLVPDCVVEVPEDMMDAASDEHVALGCAPSLNIYGAPPLNVDSRMLSLRFAGCHIHMGVGPTSRQQAGPIIRAMDALAGVASVAILEGREDPRRRMFYGKAGEYRLPPHGIEYRVPSSTILAHPVVTHLVFDLARLGVDIGEAGLRVWDTDDEHIQAIINECDVAAARALLKSNLLPLRAMLSKIYAAHDYKAERLVFGGAQNLLDMTDMTTNWQLDSSFFDYGELNYNVRSWMVGR